MDDRPLYATILGIAARDAGISTSRGGLGFVSCRRVEISTSRSGPSLVF